jgi:crotonobetaine/carnitine-CoA ligase
MTGAWPGPEETTVLAVLEHRLATDPDGQYLDVLGSPLTAVEVADAATRVASALAALGVRPGDRVATLLDNSVEAVLIWFGTLRAGGVVVPINTAYKGDYLAHPLRDSQARVLVAADQYASRVEEAEAAIPDLPTSSSWGRTGPGGRPGRSCSLASQTYRPCPLARAMWQP